MNCLSPSDIKVRLGEKKEYALLDVREQEEFSREHTLMACCAPLSRLELLMDLLVPCRTTPLYIMDGGDESPEHNRAHRAASTLQKLGYNSVTCMQGGLLAWKEAGYATVTGVGSLSKAFGELVEEEMGTPHVEPLKVKELLDSGADMLLVDVRPREEYETMTIPGSINAPGCEITCRIRDLAPNPQTLVVVHCAGRTRSIIGTQTLRNIGLPNPVVALKGGTMNWRLAGLPLEYGAWRHSAPPSWDGLEAARTYAQQVAHKHDVPFVDKDTLHIWQQETNTHNLYIFDVRQPEEFQAGHLPGSRNAPGGQLVQATDEYAAVRHGRYVLVDDNEIRSTMTAHWLRQMGLSEVYVLKKGLGGYSVQGLQRGPTKAHLANTELTIEEVLPIDLYKALQKEDPPLCINVGQSRRHRRGHVPGALWGTRVWLANALKHNPKAHSVVFIADDEPHAKLAAEDAKTLWPDARIRILKGGMDAWLAAHLPMEQGMPCALAAEDDVWYKPYEDVNAKPESMRDYFSWEAGLVRDAMRDGQAGFCLQKV